MSQIDINDPSSLSPNSIFRNKEDLAISEYYTIDELNVEMEKTPDDVLILHINAVSVIENHRSIHNFLASLKPIPSILCLTETRVPIKPTDLQLNQIRFDGYHQPMLENSPSSAGGVAIYVSEDLSYTERPDINFNFPDCEACFIEVENNTPNSNPIFGALYRHPKKISKQKKSK